MKGLLRICLFSTVLLMANQAIAVPINMNFEEFFGYDGAPLATFYSGVTFEVASTGNGWFAADVTTGFYSASSWPSGMSWAGGDYWMYDNVCAWTDEFNDAGKISFDNQDATFVEMGYCAGSELWLGAYDSDDNLIDQDSGPANRRYWEGNESGPGTLRVDWDGTKPIAYVLIHDTGDFWIVDNISIGIVPEPASAMILGLGSLFFALRRRHQ